ncbi:FAD dependent oxidoreductase-like protein [Ophiobolus disseminans]|uniref:FAD dependent oxidoreductase-like protein n=1 Tax=Ophiobolus disseminans TaxID=1469910 RepID=A0A6A7A6Y9_9PLEO|nr:FAD dependent oxidoreductase-like protein [Ophiobolus disseminans]
MDSRAQIPVGPPIHTPLPSYWHNPKSPLANLIEPSPFSSQKIYDHIIIGSGITGTLTAYFLLKSRPGLKILMLEAREVCSGATGRNGGHTKAASYRGYMRDREELGVAEALRIARMEWEGILSVHALAKELGIACESRLCRTVDVLYDQGTFEAGKKAIETLRDDAMEEEREEGGMAWYRVHEADAAKMREFQVAVRNESPAVPEHENVVGFFEYGAGSIHAYRFTTGVLKKCIALGLEVCTHTPVHSILPTPSSPSTPTSWTVHTQFGSLQTHAIILATNAYTPYLLPSCQARIVPMRGQITAQRPGANSTLECPLERTYSFIYKSGYEYMIPRAVDDDDEGEKQKQHIIIGGGLGRLPEAGKSEYGTVDDGSLNPHISTYLRHSLAGYFGASTWGEKTDVDAEQRVVQEWTGIMGATADGRPYVGEVPGKKGVWIAAGFNGHGMVLCLKSAEALVGMMDEKWGRVEWFPESFVVNGERMEVGEGFGGRRDMKVR